MVFALSQTRKFVYAGYDGTVAVSTAQLRHLVYCHPVPPLSSAPLLDWLENYVENISSGVFGFENSDIQNREDPKAKYFTLYPIQRRLNMNTMAFQRLQRCSSSTITNGTTFLPIRITTITIKKMRKVL